MSRRGSRGRELPQKLKIGEEVVDCLRQDAGPIDGVDGAELVSSVEGDIREESFDYVLTLKD